MVKVNRRGGSGIQVVVGVDQKVTRAGNISIRECAMDPTTTLNEILNMADGLMDVDTDNVTQDQAKSLLNIGCVLAEQVRNLDEWISKGGFLPSQWKAKASAYPLGSRTTTFHSSVMAPTDTEMLDWLAQDADRNVEYLHGEWIAGYGSYVLGRGETPRDAIREAITSPRVDIKDLL